MMNKLLATILTLVLGGIVLAQDKPTKGLPIPAIEDITRIDNKTRASKKDRRLTCYLVATKEHPVAGEGYVIITDHQDEAPLASLARLAKARNGKIFKISDFSKSWNDAEEWGNLRSKLIETMPRFVAIAPRPDTYGEWMLMSMLDLLSTLDKDRELDAFPGILAAPDQASFDALVTRSIEYKPQTRENFRPFVLGQVVDGSPLGIRSLQKVGIMRKLFGGWGYETPSFVMLKAKGANQKQLKADDVWYAEEPDAKKMLKELPPEARKALDDSSLVITYGHGTPGVVCSVEVGAFKEVDFSGKIVLSGSCLSSSPSRWDNPLPGRLNDGPSKERFLVRAIQNGAVISFGHMRFNGGFPYLYPVLEHWLQGGTVGEGYQRIMNAIFYKVRATPAKVLQGEKITRMAGNMMSYVVIGDPALRPFYGIRENPK